MMEYRRTSGRKEGQASVPDAAPTPRTYSVHELAELSGCTVRALRHYDEVGLVRPARAANGYRRYGAAEVERLQQVLLYREAGMPLDEIRRVLDDPAFSVDAALERHRAALQKERARIDKLLASVEKTIASRKGATKMADTERFEAFKERMAAENEQQYGAEARERWGSDAVDRAAEKLRGMKEQEWKGAQQVEEELKEALRAALAAGDDPAGPAGARIAALHREWLCAFWPEGMYTPEAHRSLAETYVSDGRFRSYYEAIAPGAAKFLRDAICA